jgi:hypothetical protein
VYEVSIYRSTPGIVIDLQYPAYPRGSMTRGTGPEWFETVKLLLITEGAMGFLNDRALQSGAALTS